MYKAFSSRYENLSEEEQESLSSSFWTDHESDEEQRECFVIDDCKNVRTEEEPEISKQANYSKRESVVKTDTGEKEKRLTEEDQNEKEHVTVEENAKDSSEIIPGNVSEEDEERKSFEREDGTDKCGELRSDKDSDCTDRKEGEGSDSDFLQNEEEIKCYTSEANICVINEQMGREEPPSKEERSQSFVNQDDLDRIEQKRDWLGEAPKRETVLEMVGSEEEEVRRYFLNTDNNFSNIEQTRLDEQKYEECKQMLEREELKHNNGNYVRAERGDECLKDDDIDVEPITSFCYIKEREADGHSVPKKMEYSVEQHENNQIKEYKYDMCVEKEAVEDYHGNTDSPTVSILTSGYGTYRPDSPRDELDYRDDCTLTGLEDDCEYHGMVDCENGDCQSIDGHRNLEMSKQQISSLSLKQSDRAATVQNPGNSLGEPAENRLGSLGRHNETDQEFDFTAESVKPISEISFPRVVGEGGCDTAKGNDCGEAGTVYQDYHHPFNLRLSKSVTLYEHRNKEMRKPKKAKFHRLKYEPVSLLEERLEQLRVSAGSRHVDIETESKEMDSDSNRHSSTTPELPSAFDAYIKGMKRSRSESDIRLQPKSFIRPVMDHPHTRNWKKTDPVAKYFQYKQEWEMFKAPGEKSRKELHWAIREQLMYQPPAPKPQRTYVPNTYVVPTEKKRSALRWEIRHDLANGIIPSKFTYT